MFIFVDESGSFTTLATELDSWCVVAAYVAPEHSRRHIDSLISRVRAIGSNNGAETKLKHLTEEQYIWFLSELQKIGGLAFAVAVDVGLHSTEEVEKHRAGQADNIIKHIDKMIHEAGRQGLTDLSEQVRLLPLQLYTQLVCQIELFHKVLAMAPLYFVQRHPPALGHFRWRLDRKSDDPTAYEIAFKKVLPAILQSISLQKPMIMLEGADYSHFERFNYFPGEEPTYLRDDYGLEIEDGEKTDIGRVIREDFQLVDSASTPGVQVADLLASGISRLFRGRFSNEETIARLLGANMVQEIRRDVPIRLISLDQSAAVSDKSARLLRIMTAATKPILAEEKRLLAQTFNAGASRK